MAETRRKIPYVNLAAQYLEEREELLPLIDRALTVGQFVGGEPIEILEEALKPVCGTEHVVALNSGTDALILGMAALGIGAGDEVITPPNSFVASTGAIVALGAKPVFVDVLDDQNIDPTKIEAAVTSRTKAIMPVHLTGRVADMDPIIDVARRHNLKIVEDAAQAIGSRYRDQPSGALGDVGCFSGHPLKNLSACGDAGFLTAKDPKVAHAVRLMRNHGLVDRDTVSRFGIVSRLDTLQAIILGFRLPRLPSIIERRRANAARYARLLDPELVFFPPERQQEYNTYHTLVVQIDCRDELQAHLSEVGIGTAIHYPIPIHLQPAARKLGFEKGSFPVCERQAKRILTLPVHPWLGEEDIAFISATVNDFVRDKGAASGHPISKVSI